MIIKTKFTSYIIPLNKVEEVRDLNINCKACSTLFTGKNGFLVKSFDFRRGLYCWACAGIVAHYVARDMNKFINSILYKAIGLTLLFFGIGWWMNGI